MMLQTRLVEELWDDIGTSDQPVELHDWHKMKAQRRSAELDDAPDLAITRDELWKRVNEIDG